MGLSFQNDSFFLNLCTFVSIYLFLTYLYYILSTKCFRHDTGCQIVNERPETRGQYRTSDEERWDWRRVSSESTLWKRNGLPSNGNRALTSHQKYFLIVYSEFVGHTFFSKSVLFLSQNLGKGNHRLMGDLFEILEIYRQLKNCSSLNS